MKHGESEKTHRNIYNVFTTDSQLQVSIICSLRTTIILSFTFLLFIAAWKIRFVVFTESLVICGGLLSGALHALSGPDHLTAILPLTFGRRWWFGLSIGAIWGFGHGVAASALGLVCCLLKGSVLRPSDFESFSYILDYAFGLTLIAIGVIGMHESNAISSSDEANESDGKTTNLTSFRSLTYPALWAIFANGCILGMSYDSLPSLAPALTVSTHYHSVSFLLSYLIGTLLAMSIAASIIGECSLCIGKFLKENCVTNLSSVSSVVALLAGSIFVAQKALNLSHAFCATLGALSTVGYCLHGYVYRQPTLLAGNDNFATNI